MRQFLFPQAYLSFFHLYSICLHYHYEVRMQTNNEAPYDVIFLVFLCFRFTFLPVYVFVCVPSSWGRDSSVGLATRYGLNDPGIESWWGRDFPNPSRPALGPTQPPIQWVPGLSWGVKQPRRGVDHPPSSSAEVKERIELYLYSHYGPSWPVTFTLVLSTEKETKFCSSTEL